MKILLSPAKSIDTSKVTEAYSVSLPIFLKESEQLIAKLKKMSAKKLAKLMHISPDLAELNEMRFKNWDKPTVQTSDVIPAVLAFSGEVYRGLDALSMTEEDLNLANDQIRILSGLYGILKPMDLLVPYRLEMGTSWQITPKVKNLYQFWGKKLAQQLNLESGKEEVIINLASSEYFKAIDKKTLKSSVITPVFKEFKNGEYKIVMMYAKHARGAMARYIVKNNIQLAEELKLYSVDGYSFDVNQSSETEWVFTR
ncbi:MAG: peroxide stress protein YaaA [Crocinitomicaceae bacterium]|nr:peroxide stress protein YaaA [Crocinitomicaceae bacterium]MCF8433777.1 peroxide stress protein YaaA [Crocinitomicaceae bacterium]